MGVCQKNCVAAPGKGTSAGEKNLIDEAEEIIEAAKVALIAIEIVHEHGASWMKILQWLGKEGGPTGMEHYGFKALFDVARRAAQATSMDPPRADYTVLATVNPAPLPPVEFAPTVPSTLTDAWRVTLTNGRLMVAAMRARAVSGERLSGATLAHDTPWMAQQAAAMFSFKQQAATAMAVCAGNLRQLVAEFAAARISAMRVNVEALAADQQRLATSGFTDEEVEVLLALGDSEDDIGASLHQLVTRDLTRIPLDYMASLGDVADILTDTAAAMSPPAAGPPAPGAQALARVQQADRQMSGLRPVAPGTVTLEVPVGNPLSDRQTITVRERGVHLPAGWIVQVTPSTLTLDPGKRQEVTLTVIPDAAALEGQVSRVALEGYAGDQLIGGVVLDVAVPRLPVASFTHTPTEIITGQPVTLTSTSHIPDRELTQFLWRLDDDLHHAHGPIVNVRFTEPGSHHVSLSVVDDTGATWTAEQALDVRPATYTEGAPALDPAAGGVAIGGASQQRLAQVITPSVTGALSRLRLALTAEAHDLTLEMQGVKDGRPDDTVRHRSYLPASAYPPARETGLRDVLLDPVPLTAAQPFALVLSTPGTWVSMSAPADSSYPGGAGWYDAQPNPPGTWEPLTGPGHLPFEISLTVTQCG